MKSDLECAPVIVMGMVRSGTTLLAEMLHKGGTPMFPDAENCDPSYDKGIKYEWPLTYELNLAILDASKEMEAISLVGRPIRPFSPDELKNLRAEAPNGAWGFKDPRTTLTYPVWCEVFGTGPRLYIYRGHEEVLRHYYNSSGKLARLGRVRRAMRAWVEFNEQLLKNLSLDQNAGRPAALVRYEELMEEKTLIGRLEKIVGVALYDARNWDLRRNTVVSRPQKLTFRLAALGYKKRIANLYRELGALRVQKDSRG